MFGFLMLHFILNLNAVVFVSKFTHLALKIVFVSNYASWE